MDPQVDSNQQFCLRWHNYQSSLLSSLPQLLDGDDLTDVTLGAGGRHLKAHKVVLSACSDYFKQLFKELDGFQHPVIILPGVNFNDLYALVTFMYNGEVNIYQQQLACLLTMADTLQIRGLAEFTGDPQDYSTNKQSSNRSSPASQSNTSGKGKRQRLSPQTGGSPSDPSYLSKSLTPQKTDSPSTWLLEPNGPPFNEAQDLSRKAFSDPGSKSGTSIDCLQNVCKNLSSSSAVTIATGSPETAGPSDLCLGGPGASSTAASSRPSGSKPPGGGGGGGGGTGGGASSKLFATCFVCGKQLSNQYNLRVHMETHQNAFYACSSCNHVSRSRDALRKHVSYRHPHATP